MKHLHVILDEANHEKLLLLREALEKPNLDETIAEIISRTFEEVARR